MNKLTLFDIFEILKVREHKDTIYKILHKVDPGIREELIKYLEGD